jgi:hypothetical protein
VYCPLKCPALSYRKQSLLCATGVLLVLLCLQALVCPDIGSFTTFESTALHDVDADAGLPGSIRMVDISFRTSFFVLSWGLRLVMGIPLGVLLVAVIVYASELPLPQERGHYMAYLPLAYLAGTWLALLITLLLHHHVNVSAFSFLANSLSWKPENLSHYSLAIRILGNEWRWHLLVPFLSCVVLLVGFNSSTNWLILTPESPYWLLANDSTTMPTTALVSASSKKRFLTTKQPPQVTNTRVSSASTRCNVDTHTTMDAYTALLLIRGGGKTPTALREVSLEFSNMYRALAQDAVSEQSWRDLCLGTSDISLRYRLLLLWILVAVQVFLGPFLLFEMSRWFSLLLLDKDPYLGGDDDEMGGDKYVHDYQVCQVMLLQIIMFEIDRLNREFSSYELHLILCRFTFLCCLAFSLFLLAKLISFGHLSVRRASGLLCAAVGHGWGVRRQGLLGSSGASLGLQVKSVPRWPVPLDYYYCVCVCVCVCVCLCGCVVVWLCVTPCF